MSIVRGWRSGSSAVRRLALGLAAVAHLALACVAPFAEAASERTTFAHVEQTGTCTLPAHVEATCFVCSSQFLLLPPRDPAAAVPHAKVCSGAIVGFERRFDADPHYFPLGSRAPPHLT